MRTHRPGQRTAMAPDGYEHVAAAVRELAERILASLPVEPEWVTEARCAVLADAPGVGGAGRACVDVAHVDANDAGSCREHGVWRWGRAS